MNESTRLAMFRQMKNEPGRSKKHLVMGIDVAKEPYSALFGIPVGKTLLRSRKDLQCSPVIHAFGRANGQSEKQCNAKQKRRKDNDAKNGGNQQCT